ncbi:hypothetical protein LF845_05870, partial [Deferribacterales bacterium Es71-Z0220]|uniref:hypothetical protein n=1 Tax=Deferrivibrio essentukiensis TaxID=2880922 RepID=UPI001F626145
LLHLSNKEFYRLRKEWFNYVKPYLNDEQLNKVGKWEENLEKRKLNKEQRFYLEPWQVREFEELEQEMERRGYISFDKAKDVRSFKASAKFLGVKVLEYLKGNKVDALVKFLRLFNAEIKSKETKSGRVRHYLNLPYKDKRKEGIRFVDVRIDNLTPELREVLDGVYRIYRENRNIEERAGAVKKGNTATKEQENPIDKGNTTIRGQEKPINKGYQGIGTEERVNSRRQESSKCSMEFREQQSQRTSAQRITKNSKNLRSPNFFDNTNHGDKKNRKNNVKNNFDLNNYFIVIWNPQKKEKIHLEIGKVIDVDFGVKISMINENSALIQGGTAQTQAVIAIKLAKKLKWKGISTNSDDKEFIKHLVSYAKKNNIKFVPKNDFQKEILMANELADNSGNVFGPTL